MNPLLESLIENLQAEGLLGRTPKTKLLLAYSGGADSTALLHLLSDIKHTAPEQFPLDITAAYFNHGWRGQFIEELPILQQNCLQCEVPLVIIQLDKTITHTESAARTARYDQLLRLAKDLKVDAVLTAHHADDQVETILFRLLRGTGIDGLAGIQKRLEFNQSNTQVKQIPVLRPLLDVARKNLLEYLHDKQTAYFEDPSNANEQFQRNYLRNQLIPTLSQAFPNMKNALFRLSLVAQGDLEILDDCIRERWQALYGQDPQGDYLDVIRFNQLGVPYQRRLMKQFLATHQLYLDFQAIEELLAFVRGDDRKNLDSALKSLPNTESGRPQFLALYKNKLRILVDPEREPQPFSTEVPIPGYLQIPELNATFYAQPWLEPEKVTFSPIRPHDSQQAFVNLGDFAQQTLSIRTRQPGDVFQPVGMDKPVKLKNFLINRGVPRFERSQLKMLALGKEILWIPGLGISQKLKVPHKGRASHLLKLKAGLHPEEEWRFTTETTDDEPKFPPEAPSAFTPEELLTGAEPL